jgi:alpha-glucosidase
VSWGELSVAAQTGDPDSMLELYRSALRVRRDHPAFRSESLTWLDSPAGVRRFTRGGGFEVVVNVTAEPVDVELGHRRVLLASAALVGRRLAGDAAVWLG